MFDVLAVRRTRATVHGAGICSIVVDARGDLGRAISPTQWPFRPSVHRHPRRVFPQGMDLGVLRWSGRASLPRPLARTSPVRRTSPLSAVFALVASALLATPAAAADAVVPAAFTITGSGNGHGVGMSQWGARGMAAEGAGYADILAHYYPGTTLSATSSLASSSRSELIRVGIGQDVQAVALRGEALGGNGANLDITVGSTTRTVPAGVTTTITLVNGVAHVTFPDTTTVDGSHVVVTWNGTTTNGSNPGVVNVGTGSTASAAASALGGLCGNFFAGAATSGSCNHRYRYGQIEIDSGRFGDSVRNLNVVVTQRLDDEYVKGIGEVPSSWPVAALQAQAVAARSYALASVLGVHASSSSVTISGYDRKVRASCLCQVLNNTSDQNYVGFSKEYATSGSRWVAAVEATLSNGAGQVVTYGTTVVKAFYAASTGGKTQAVRDVWGSTSMPWLASVDDHWSLEAPNPDAAWVDSISQATLVAQVNGALASAYNRAVSGGLTCSKVQVGDIARIEVLSRYASGGVRQLGLADSGGNPVTLSIKAARGCTNITADRLRYLLGVPSTYVSGFAASSSTLPGNRAVSVRAVTRVSLLGLPPVMVNPSGVAVSGATTPAQYGAAIAVQERVDGQWNTLATTTTSVRGTWSVTIAAPIIGQHTYRVVARNAVSTKRSVIRNVSVVGQIALTAPRRAALQSTTTVTGQVIPAVAGVEVRVERIVRGRWRRVATATTDASGVWSAAVAIPRVRATYKFRARTTDPRIGAVSSRLRRVVGY